MSDILVIAEHDDSGLKPATLHAVAAAAQLKAKTGGAVHLLLAGASVETFAAEVAQTANIDRLYVAQAPHLAHGLPEHFAPLVVELVRGTGQYGHLVATASSFGKNVMPRIAALLDVALVSDLVEVVTADTFVRPIYAGNVLATVQTGDAWKVLTVRATAFEALAETSSSPVPVEKLTVNTSAASRVRFVSKTLTKLERPELGHARVVVSGGRALGSAEQFDALLQPLADILGAAIGASRAAVDAGYVPNDFQVGQTGKIVAPQLYIAIGISGAIQHLAGMKGAKVIVAINKDADAPIFQIADYGLVADIFQAVPALTAALQV